jgi:hypothetical protein
MSIVERGARLSLDEARSILGDDVLGPQEVSQAFSGAPTELEMAIPFTREALITARRCGAMLVLRAARDGEGKALTILHLLERCPQVFDAKLLRKAGYQLKDEWGIALEPLAANDTCGSGWALVRKEVLEDSCNLSYDQQEVAVQRFADSLRVPVRRRTAVEGVYDTMLCFLVRKVRLLEHSWDWSSSATLDGGYLNVGGFSPTGMQILSFSRAIRHGRLGVCPTHQPRT